MNAAPQTTAAPTIGVASPNVAVQAIFAMLLGAFLLGMAGFAPIEAVHNTAHDARHSMGLPCH